MSIKLFVPLAAALLLFSSNSFADTKSAQNYIEKVADKTLLVITDSKLDNKQKQQKLKRLFEKNIDLKWVGKFALGINWRKADKKARERYLKAYKEFMLDHYAARFTEYSSGKFDVVDARDLGDNETIVEMEVAGSLNDPTVFIDYKIRKKGRKHQIFDIIIEGVSMITTQRSEFASVISSKGLEGLIGSLENKNLALASE